MTSILERMIATGVEVDSTLVGRSHPLIAVAGSGIEQPVLKLLEADTEINAKETLPHEEPHVPRSI